VSEATTLSFGYSIPGIQGNDPATFPATGSVYPVRAIFKDGDYTFSLKYKGNYFDSGYEANNMPVMIMGYGEELKKLPWAWESEHLLIGRNTLSGYTFVSDDRYPLMFKVIKEKGYVYLCGGGTVITPDGKELKFGIEDSIDKWILRITAQDQLEREAAVFAVGWLSQSLEDEQKVLSVLIDALDDTSWEVRRNAAEALGRLKNGEAVGLLQKTLESDTDGWVRLVAKESIGLIAVSESEKGLHQGKIEEVTKLLQLFSEQEISFAVLKYAEDALLKNSEIIIDPLMEILKDKNSELRAKAAELLGNIGDAKAVEPLLVLLRDQNPDLRETAAEALGKTRNPNAVDPLITALGHDESWRVRDKAAEALGQIKDSRAVDPLIAALNDKKWFVGQSAAEALGEIKNPRAVEPLIVVVKRRDEEFNFRAYSIRALGKIKDPRAIEPLIAVLNNETGYILGWAASALKDLTNKDFGEDPVEWNKWWDQNKDKILEGR
jgi:HEAT repeat protein